MDLNQPEPYKLNGYTVLGEFPYVNDNTQATMTKFGILQDSLEFGMVTGTNRELTNQNHTQLYANTKMFRFDQCDTEALTQSQITLPYIPTSIAFTEFIILSNKGYRNWNGQPMNNPSFLNDNKVLKSINVCLFGKINKLNQKIVNLQMDSQTDKEQIKVLQNTLQTKDILFIVCMYVAFGDLERVLPENKQTSLQ